MKMLQFFLDNLSDLSYSTGDCNSVKFYLAAHNNNHKIELISFIKSDFIPDIFNSNGEIQSSVEFQHLNINCRQELCLF